MRIENQEPETGRSELPETAAPPAAPTLARLHFEIKDTGVGIAPDEIEQVFEAFVQTNSGQRSQQGTGLGLPISREYVRLMGGDLIVQSEVGVGSTFAFDVQVEVVDTIPTDVHPAYQLVGLEPGQPVYRILIAEDDDASRTLLVKFLTPLGFEVSEAYDGAEAVAQWEAWQPHLIFMDMRMPVMNGRQATQEIKSRLHDRLRAAGAAHPAQVQTRIIALTASAFEEERESFLNAGCDDFVRKPFREAAIIEILTRHLGVRFVYAPPDSARRSTIESQRQSLNREKLIAQLKMLDPLWRASMQQATVEGDLKQMEILVAEIGKRAPELAGQLAQLLYNFEHDEILKLLQASNPN